MECVSAVAISAIVVNHRRPELLDACLDSIFEALARIPEHTQTIVVDNASLDGSCNLIRRSHPETALIALAENRGFAAGVAAGLEQARGEWILLVNNDATVAPDAALLLLAAGRSASDVGSVAAQMVFADRPEVINSAGIEVDSRGSAHDRGVGEPREGPGPAREVFGASGGAALLRRSMLESVGGFDTSFFLFMEDADLAWRARMHGWRCLYTPAAVVEHHHSATARHGSPLKHYHAGRNRIRMLAKNADPVWLRRRVVAIVVRELAHVTAQVVADRTFAPVRGRLAGLREWSRYRAAGRPGRRPVELGPAAGLGTLRRRRAAYRAGIER